MCCRFYYSFIIHLRGTFSCFRIAVLTCMAGDVLAFSCGMTECEHLPIERGGMDYAFRLQYTVAFRHASLFVFISKDP